MKYFYGIKRNKLNFIAIVLAIYYSFIFISLLLSLGDKYDPVKQIGEFQFYSGVLLFVLGVVIIGHRRGLYYIESMETVKARRERDRPIEYVALIISASGILLFLTGFTLLNLFY